MQKRPYNDLFLCIKVITLITSYYLILLTKIAKKRSFVVLICDNAQLFKRMFVYSALILKL